MSLLIIMNDFMNFKKTNLFTKIAKLHGFCGHVEAKITIQLSNSIAAPMTLNRLDRFEQQIVVDTISGIISIIVI